MNVIPAHWAIGEVTGRLHNVGSCGPDMMRIQPRAREKGRPLIHFSGATAWS